MKILFEYNGIIPVKTYGGTERILYWLMKELVILGHEVYLIAAPESQVDSIGVRLIKRTDASWRHLVPPEIDILHLFLTPSEPLPDHPFVVTIHGNGRQGEQFHCNTIFLSKKHAANHHAECFVYNGIDFDEYPFVPKQNNWQNFLFLAKASWKVKNLRDCVRACRQTKKHLHIAGGNKYSLSRYIHSHGMVNQKQKLALFQQVDALLWPVRWHEPFGVAIIEAFSQGVPVIGSSFGSLPELISRDNGVLCQNYEEFLHKLGTNPRQFDPEQIRRDAQQRFSAHSMAVNYLKLYQRVLDGEKLNPIAPYGGTIPPQDLLPF